MDSLSFISDICGALKKIKRTGWVKHHIPLPESDADHMHRCAMCALLLSQPADPRDQYDTPTTEIYHPSKIGTTKLLRMAVTHDLCEALAGDITPHCDPTLVASKHVKEDQAMRSIQKVVAGPLGEELYQLWKEYEDQKTVEAIYCKDIDKFEMVVQAYEYEKDHLLSKDDAAKKQSEEEEKEDAPPAKKQKPSEDISLKTGGDFRTDVRVEPLRGFFASTSSTMKTPLFRRLDAELRERREKLLLEKGWSVADDEQQTPL